MLRVQGLAASLPFDAKDPHSAANRRISIIVMNREAEDRIFRSGSEVLEPQAAAEPIGTGWLPNLPR
jgi:chemotaxis protein MotB